MGETSINVRALGASDGPAAVMVINVAAEWYAEFLAPSEVEQPEMTLESWTDEAARMTWHGAFDGDELVGVMGVEYAGDAVLLRHAYVLPNRQRQGIAGLIREDIERSIEGIYRVIVGTYAGNYKARDALEKAGFHASPDPEVVLRRYYDIPEERLQSSVTYEKLKEQGRS